MTERDQGSPLDTGYRLGAESPEEAAQFAEVATTLGLASEPVEPPASLRADIMAKLASTPQLAPFDDSSSPQTAPVESSTIPDARTGPAEQRARSRWFTRPIAIAAAAVAALVLFVGGAVVGSSLAGHNSFEAQQASSLAQLNAASDVQHATSPVTGGGTATLVWSGELGKSAVVVTGLQSLPDNKTYELWYLRDGAATPAGTMVPSDSGATWRVLEGAMAPGDAVGITVEPQGGSTKPTTAPIVAIKTA